VSELVKVTLHIKRDQDKYINSISEHHGYKSDFIRKAIDEAIKKDKRKRKGEQE
jgi:hypothetical protein